MCMFFFSHGEGAGGVESVLWTQGLCPPPLDSYAEALISSMRYWEVDSGEAVRS